MIRFRARSIQRALVSVMAVAVAVVGVSVVAWGVTPWLLLAVAACPWILVLARRVGALLSLCAVVLCAYLSVLATTMITGAAKGDPLAALTAVLVVLGWVGSAALARESFVGGRARTGGSDRALPVLAAAGPAIWGIAAIFWAFLSPERRLGWVMRNDSVNNIVFAREAIAQHGIVIGGDQNPAPLPAAIIAIAASAGRSGTPPGQLLEHDLAAMSATWMLLIALTAFLAACTAGEVARRAGASRTAIRWSTLLGSLFVFSWYLTGYPMEYGFINVSVALPILFISVLLFLRTSARPTLALSGLLIATLLMLAVWSPLVVVPAALALAAIVLDLRRVLRLRRGRLAVLLGSLLALLLYFGGVSVPSLLGQQGALSSAGGVHPGMEWVVFVAGFLVLAAAFILSRLQVTPLLTASCAVVLSSWLGATALLVLNRHAASPWTYYPVKFVWIASVIVLTMLLGMVVSAVDRVRVRWARGAASAGIVAAIAFLMIWSPTTVNFDGINPVARLFAIHPLENLDKVHRYVLATADPEHPTVAWRLLSPSWADGEANVWLIQDRSDEPSLSAVNRKLVTATYGATDVAALCKLQKALGPGLTVQTTDRQLGPELLHACPESTARVVVRSAPR